MSKFKKGDRVKCINFEGDRDVLVGLIGTVMENDDSASIKWDGLAYGHTYKDGSGWYVHVDYLVKAHTFKGNK